MVNKRIGGTMERRTYIMTLRDIVQDPQASTWLKEAAQALDTLPPRKALEDSKVLYALQVIRNEY